MLLAVRDSAGIHFNMKLRAQVGGCVRRGWYEGRGLEELEVGGGGEFEDEAEESGYFYEDAAFGGSFDAEEVAFVTVHGAVADNAYALAVHVGGDFFRAYVAWLLLLADGCDECVHVGGAYGHRLTVGSFYVAVLQCGCFFHDRVELGACAPYEQKVAHEGDFLAYVSAGF